MKLSTFEKRSRFLILFARRTFPRLTIFHALPNDKQCFLKLLGRQQWSSQLEMDPSKFSENICENSILFVALLGNRLMGVCLRFLDL